MIIVRSVIALLFITFAVVQFNDPDPWLWILLYSYVAGMAIIGHFFIKTKYWLLAGMLICIIWMLTLLPEFIDWIQMGAPSIVDSMKAEQPHIEFVREFLGLLLSLFAMYMLYRFDRRSDL